MTQALAQRLSAGPRMLREAWREYERDYARYYAGAIVFYALVSLVPLLLLFLGTVGVLLRHSRVVDARARQLLDAIEAGFGADLREGAVRLSDQLQQGSLVVTVLSLAVLLVTASRLFHHLRMTFRAVWKHESPLSSGALLTIVLRTALEKAKAVVGALAGGALLLLAIVLEVVLHWLVLRTPRVPWPDEAATRWLGIMALLVLVPGVFALLLRYLPPVTVAWRHVLPASVLCGMAWLIGFELVALYSAGVGTRFGAYGALGGVLVAMVWLNLSTQLLFLGAEFSKLSAQRGDAAITHA